MTRKWRWKDWETVPSYAVPNDMLRAGDYRPGGYACWGCDWRTDKTGYSGRQAARGHSKVHTYDRRAWQRPLWLVAVVVLLIAMITTLSLRGVIDLAEEPVITIAPIAEEAILYASPTVAGLMGLVWTAGWLSPSRLTVRLLRGSELVALLPAFAVMIGAIGLVSITFALPHLILAGLGLAEGLYLAVASGHDDRLRRRRRRVPGGYVAVAKAKDWDAEFELESRLRKSQGRGRQMKKK